MCTLVVLRRPGHPWPLLLAANRDELSDRPWSPPGRHWPDHPHVVAGRDDLAGGSWLALADHGLVAAVLNRRGTLGPQAGRRSRGQLALDALAHPDAATAADVLAGPGAGTFRPFNLVIADPARAFWLRDDGERVTVHALADGLSMLTAGELDDPSSARIAGFRPRFAAAPPPDPDRGDWTAWERLLADTGSATGDPRGAMTIRTDGAYGTVSSALIALAAGRRRFRFAPGPPDTTPFEEVAG
jgi:uncharacterized protein with NRDE domain